MLNFDVTGSQKVAAPEGKSGAYYSALIIANGENDTLPQTGAGVEGIADEAHFAVGSVLINLASHKVYMKSGNEDTDTWVYVGSTPTESEE